MTWILPFVATTTYSVAMAFAGAPIDSLPYWTGLAYGVAIGGYFIWEAGE